MFPDQNDRMVRVETSFRADDYEILTRVATARRISVAALLRRLVYDHVQPMQMAQLEREKLAMQEARERRALRDWIGKDPVRVHEEIVDRAIQEQ